MSITVVDSIMGSGKSTWAFNFMNSHPEKKFIFITQFVDECTRAEKECRSIGMKQPKKNPSKQADFLMMVKKDMNIATTHSLFCQLALTKQVIGRIQKKKYTLIIDEVFETVQPFDKLTKKSLDRLMEDEYIEIDEEGRILPSGKKKLSVWEGTPYEEVLPYFKAGSLISYEGKILLRVFPVQTLELSQEIYILTYLFDASHLKHTLTMNHYEYVNRWINQNGELTDEPQDYGELKRTYKNLIDIYKGTMNKDGEEEYALSSTKWKSKYTKTQKQHIANHARSYFMYGATKKIVPAEYCLWAVYGEKKKTPDDKSFEEARIVNVQGYSMSCIPFNERATNEYGDRYVLAYLVNVFEHRMVKNWFERKGVNLDDNLFALSTMLQWIWRSRIRNYKPNDGKEYNIYLYLPSKRMRNLLNEWLENKR